MKKELAAFGIIGTLCLIFAAVTANAYVFENFDQGVGNPPNGWGAGSGVIVSNDATIKIGIASLFIPTTVGVTNYTGSVANDKVWTDFYTVPRPFVSGSQDAPTIDSNSTAQIFVKTNGLWATISGNGGAGFQTNTWTQPVLAGMIYPTVTQYSAFYHVSVLHDYSASNWSLFVNDVLLATNLQFIASGVSTHTWFQVQNLGGNATNVCWVDNFLVTNKISTATTTNGLTNSVPGTTVPVSDVLVHFGSAQDPRPTNKTVGVVGTGVALTFGRVNPDGRQYIVYGTADQALGGLLSNGVATISSGSAAFTNYSLSGSTNRYYYKLVTVSSDGAVTVTNDESYASYKQYRYSNKYSIVGIPVDAADRSMGGALGAQLASGLANNDQVQMTENGVPYKYQVFNGGMNCVLGPDGLLTKQWPLGVGMVVLPAGVPTPSFFAGLKVSTNVVSVTVSNNVWSYLAWTHNDATFSGDGSSVLGFSPSANDNIYIQTNGAANFVSARFIGTNWLNLITLSPVSMTIRAGDGIVYKTTGGTKTFSSVGP